ncbi:MAG: flagellin [Gemmatimonadaceae bacterium]|nr:flagellin [Acetobacteraceae bacterium]
MALNSVNTNIGAQVALESLNFTNTALQASQKRISTGLRVADATDDGGAYAVAQRVRSDVGALTSVNEQLGNAKGLVGTSLSALGKISDSLNTARGILVKIADSSIADDQRTQYVASYKSLVVQVANYVDNSTYNGQTLLGKVAGGAVAGASKSVVNSEVGSTTTISAADASGLANTLAGLIGSTFGRTAAGVDTFGTATGAASQTAAALALTATTGSTAFTTALTGVANTLNQSGADANLLDATISFNSVKIDSLNAGLGALIDTDLSKESARLQSLQIRQQLGTQALSLANQAPQSLLSLFR